MPTSRIQLESAPVLETAKRDVERLVAQKRGLFWVDLIAPTEAELSRLQRTFEFHPLSIEDSSHFCQRSKVDVYDGYLFISLYAHRFDKDKQEILADELHVFLGSNYLVTVHREPLPALSRARERYERETEAYKRGPDFFLYLIGDELVDSYFPLLDDLEAQIDELEEQIGADPGSSVMRSIFSLKQELIHLRKATGPQREVFNSLSTRHYDLIDRRLSLYFQDVYDHIVRIYEMIETHRELLGNALDAYYSATSTRLNEVMKRLTLIATIFMPLSVLTGLGGVNFRHMPFESPVAFGLLLASIVFVPVSMWLWFKSRRWM
ncbi:MAG: magnesium/cobalt transporter CorA [Acidimicrobiia bacterium]|nr:magnesium/cobalt transporter CorA [Acidimicrobiia bacterium]